jgi:hypothetical protein
MSEEDENFSFCETIAATGPWHIRRLTKNGKKLRGGADTKTLCGFQAAWDINCEIIEVSLNSSRDEPGHTCSTCKKKYLEIVAMSEAREERLRLVAWLRNVEPVMDLLDVPNRGSERFEARSVLLDLASLLERSDTLPMLSIDVATKNVGEKMSRHISGSVKTVAAVGSCNYCTEKNERVAEIRLCKKCLIELADFLDRLR